MDGELFDRIVRRLAATGSRRGLLGFLALVAGWLSLLAADARKGGKRADGRKGGKRHGRNRPRRRHARRRHKRKHKKRKKDQPQDQCSPQSPDGPCAGDQLCVEGVCQDCTVTCEGDPGACGAALQAAINAAAAAPAEPILVCPGRYGGNFVISAGVALVGANNKNNPRVDTILDAQGAGQVLFISSCCTGEVTLVRLRITGGFDLGGGIFNFGRMLTMTRCTVSGNTAPADGPGGGIFNEGGPLTLRDCLIEGNTAAERGGGIYVQGDITLTGSTEVRGNAAQNGGGIYVQFGNVTIDAGCRVTENTADGAGGGIFLLAAGGGTVSLENDQIVTDNDGGNCAGAVIDHCNG